MYEFFDHTADLGLRVRSTSLNGLFEDAAKALFAAIVDGLDSVRRENELEIEIVGTDREYLLFDWLRELLYRFEVDHVLLSKFQVEVGEAGLKAKAWGEPIDAARHVLSHEVKAITYHALRVERVGEEWIAEVIVDI